MLKLGLLGRPFFHLNNTPLPQPLSTKAQGLVYYLAVTEQAHSREALAGLLWSDLDEARARRNLRVELAKIRPFLTNHLIIQRRSVAFDRDADFELDVATFLANLNRPQPSLAQLETAVSLYRGDFLEDFSLRGAILFEEWVLVQRERLRQMALDGLYKLARGYEAAGELEKGITAVRRLLTLEPWLEAAHRQLMVLLAKNGQRAAALAQYDICTALLMAELGVTPAPETDALYDQIEAGSYGPRQSPNLPVSQSPDRLIPFQPLPPTDHFVGRDAEIATLRHQLTQPSGPHLVALVGMGGVGKSTLANQTAHALRHHFADGILWADTKASEPLDILDSWGKAYGYDFSGLADVNNRAAAVRGMLADKSVLVVLDDVGQISRIRPLIPNGAGCAILLTTRDLDVASGLNAEEILLGELSPANGVRLLTNILGAERVQAEPEAAAEICTRLHNLPLAVEITAQRLKSRRRRKLADMAQRLADIEQRLSLEISDRAVRASFEVSWAALDATLQHIFGLLGVFQGRPFAAPALAHIANLDPYTTEDHLFSLTALSLLAEEGDIHFRQHPLLADFAREKLAASDSSQTAHERMAVYYQQFAAAHPTDYATLQPEWPNLMAGMQTAHAQENWPLVLAYADTLSEPWLTRARFSEMRQGLAWAEKAAVALADPVKLASILLRWGQVCLEQNDYERAETLLQRSLHLFSEKQQRVGEADVHYQLGRLYLEQSALGKAKASLEQCLAMRLRLEDTAGIAAAIYRQARIVAAEGNDRRRAQQLAERALALQEEVEAERAQIATLRLLAEIALAVQENEQAKAYSLRAQALSSRLGDRGELAASHYTLAVALRRLGELTMARQLAEESLGLFKQMGSQRWQGMLLYQLSGIELALHEYEAVLALSEESLKLFELIGDEVGKIYAWLRMSQAYKQLGNEAAGRSAWQRANGLAVAVGQTAVMLPY